MRPDQVAELKNNDVLRGRLAKYLARECFRNTKLEDLHAGQVPVSKTGDYSDVKVVTPDRQIAWNDVSRISNSEMKELMIDAITVVTNSPPRRVELSSPRRPLERFTNSTPPSSIIRRMLKSFSGAVSTRLRSGSARNAPILFCIGAIPSARQRR
jgi:hypothetical protein